MAKKPFMPRTDLERLQWLQNFAAKLPTYATKYNIAAAEQDDMTDGAVYFEFWMNAKNLTDEYNKKLTQFKNELRDGIPAGADPSVEPAAPTLGAVPDPVLPGLFVRAGSIGAVIKTKSNYTVADGNDLGIEGTEESATPGDIKPAIKTRLVEGGKPEIIWKKNGMDSIEIWADRGTGFSFLAIDSTPNYVDTHDLPNAGQTAIWKYKSIYREDDGLVGEWSDVIAVTVTG